jgi:hypothetical protein
MVAPCFAADGLPQHLGCAARRRAVQEGRTGAGEPTLVLDDLSDHIWSGTLLAITNVVSTGTVKRIPYKKKQWRLNISSFADGGQVHLKAVEATKQKEEKRKKRKPEE